jgi:hypothetical protein
MIDINRQVHVFVNLDSVNDCAWILQRHCNLPGYLSADLSYRKLVSVKYEESKDVIAEIASKPLYYETRHRYALSYRNPFSHDCIEYQVCCGNDWFRLFLVLFLCFVSVFESHFVCVSLIG